jgi:hypothetical protein
VTDARLTSVHPGEQSLVAFRTNGLENGSDAKLVVSPSIIREEKLFLPRYVSPLHAPVAEVTTNFVSEPSYEKIPCYLTYLLTYL